MNFDKSPAEEKKEQLETPKEKLKILEKSGKFVFHGSLEHVDILEPKQAYNSNKETKQKERDGNPAVFATPYADVAIFRALVNAKDVIGESESTFGMDGENLHFSATKNLLEQAIKKIGKVYVLDKQKFNDFKGMQCRSEESIIPTMMIEVTAKDLPENIKTKEKPEHIPASEEVQLLFEKIIGETKYETARKLEDEQGLYLWEIKIAQEDGSVEYEYVRKGDYKARGLAGGSASETAIHITYFDEDEIPISGQYGGPLCQHR